MRAPADTTPSGRLPPGTLSGDGKERSMTREEFAWARAWARMANSPEGGRFAAEAAERAARRAVHRGFPSAAAEGEALRLSLLGDADEGDERAAADAAAKLAEETVASAQAAAAKARNKLGSSAPFTEADIRDVDFGALRVREVLARRGPPVMEALARLREYPDARFEAVGRFGRAGALHAVRTAMQHGVAFDGRAAIADILRWEDDEEAVAAAWGAEGVLGLTVKS